MATNQLHGKAFEKLILQYKFPACPTNLKSNLKFDVPKEYDKELGLNTAIKVSCNNIIGLSDARSFWLIDEDVRFVIGLYQQLKNYKRFIKIYEVIISPENIKKLQGDIGFKEIESFHNKLLSFGRGRHDKARDYAKKVKKELQAKSLIVLNPKIDSKIQRRLQCSVSLELLLQHAVSAEEFLVNYAGLAMPFKIKSTLRTFNKT